MTDTMLTAESSSEGSRPIELYDIAINPTTGSTWHLCSGVRDVFAFDRVYTALAMVRSQVAAVGAGAADRALEVTLPIDHPLVKRYLQQGIPPRSVTVTVWRHQEAAEAPERIWSGDVTSMACAQATATFRVSSRIGSALLRVIPSMTAGRGCPYVLYGTACGVSRTGTGPTGLPHKVTTTVLHVDGRDVRIDLAAISESSPLRATWAEHGELVHIATGERMTIGKQTDPGFTTVTVLTLQAQIVGLKTGDTVEVFAGCNWDIATCDQKFDNLANHGGYPYMPTENPFVWGMIPED
jgi:hypothetical protein